MRRILALVMVALLWASSATAQPVNEWTINRPTYTVKGDGVAYNDGTLKESDSTIDYSNPTKWENLETPTPWFINTSNLTLSIGRHGHTKSTIQPDGIFWLNTTTWALTAATSWAVPVVTENPTSVFLDGILADGDGDAELTSTRSGILWDYVFNNTTGWTANPYPVGESALIVRYQLGKNHNITVDDGQAVNWGGTVASQITFETAGEVFDIASVEATDADNAKYPITYYLRNAQGKDWFMEGIPAADFSAATLPIRYHYTTKSGNSAANESWSGTIYVSGTFTMNNTYTLDIAAGTAVKFGDNDTVDVGLLIASTAGKATVSGTEASPVYFTSCNDETVGETITYVSETECTGNAVAAADWGGITLSADVEWDWFIVKYTGDANEPAVHVAAGGDGWLKNFKMEEHGGTGRIFWFLSSAERAVTIQDFMIHSSSANAAAPFYFDYQATTGTVTIRNGLIVVDAEEVTNGGFTHYDAAKAGAGDIDNITVICTAVGNGNIGFTHRGLHANDSSHNISVYGCHIAFNGLILDNSSHDNNNAYNYNTAWAGVWSQGASETILDPGYSAVAAATTWEPSWADDYHLGSGANLIDAGSDTAANLGLDSSHTEENHEDDTGTVDIGFHFFDSEITGGGSPAPPSGGDPPPAWGGSGPHGSGYDRNGNPRWGWGLTNWGKTQGRW